MITAPTTQEKIDIKPANRLFPVFLKLDQLSTLVIGGGNVGAEKLRALLGNDPAAKIRVVAETVSAELRLYLAGFEQVTVEERSFVTTDLEGID
ncbi:MAG: NAD(P)-dependent oxidoreductase, partial [Bacteroidota bacterium]